MTYREFYDEVAKRLTGSFKVQVETWNHRNGDPPTTTWEVWDSGRGIRYSGTTPDEAIKNMDKAPPIPDDPCVVVSVGSASDGGDVPF